MGWNNSFDTLQQLYLGISRILRYAKLLTNTLYVGVKLTTEITQKNICWREIKGLMRQMFYSPYLRIVGPTHLESGSLGCLNPQYEGVLDIERASFRSLPLVHTLSAGAVLAVLHATVHHSVCLVYRRVSAAGFCGRFSLASERISAILSYCLFNYILHNHWL
jgi:hypothetical protein